MRVVIEGLAARDSTSLGVVVEHLLEGWAQLDSDDQLHVVLSAEAGIAVPATVTVHPVDLGRRARLARVGTQNVLVPRLCRKLGADAMLSVLAATTIAPLPCPRVVTVLDMRHEVLPHQFSREARVLRKVSYGLGFRQADAVVSISERTRDDVLRGRPWLRRRPLGVALLGSDHVASWSRVPSDQPYAVAFGQHTNKNVDMVIDAWAVLRDRGSDMPIKLIGMSDADRVNAKAHIERLGLTELVTPLGWLSRDELRQCFASAALFVFPSDFEGFGLPAVEAMRLGIPLVITPERGLLEVTDGLATIMGAWGAVPLADAVEQALTANPADLERARHHAEQFTWAATAKAVRDTISEAIARGGPHDRAVAARRYRDPSSGKGEGDGSGK